MVLLPSQNIPTPLAKAARRSILSGLLALSILFPATAILAQPPAATPDIQQLALQVSKKISGLTNYSVFDDIRFQFKGANTVILIGYASTPTLKSDAARAAKDVTGITTVDNQIEVLPFSPNDDNIRVRVYNAIYTEAALRKYNANAGVIQPSLMSAAGGITSDPPIGFHAIHIIVKNGNVILRGIVLSKQDSDLAKLRANAVPGVFGVDNQLTIEGAKPEK